MHVVIMQLITWEEKSLGISELPIMNGFSCGEDIGNGGVSWPEEKDVSGHQYLTRSVPPATGWLHSV